MFEFATGDIEKCFGPDFSICHGMIPPRTPCGDLQLITSRVVGISTVSVATSNADTCRRIRSARGIHGTLMKAATRPNALLGIDGDFTATKRLYLGCAELFTGFPTGELFFRNHRQRQNAA
ncbi:hypothetical protein O9992_14525 [Vibrio lentus]|nr:hypothetical protein [Vibrio lentus]